jgi:2-isopropylmalate synthase
VIRLSHEDIGRMMSTAYGLELPRDLQAEFARTVRRHAGADEITASEIRAIFDREYLVRTSTVALLLRCAAGRGAWWLGLLSLRLRRQELIRRADCDAAASCADRLRAMGMTVRILDTHRTWAAGGKRVAVYVRCEAGSPVWGVGIAHDVVTASRRAVLSAVSRSRHSSRQEACHEAERKPGQAPVGESAPALPEALPH